MEEGMDADASLRIFDNDTTITTSLDCHGWLKFLSLSNITFPDLSRDRKCTTNALEHAQPLDSKRRHEACSGFFLLTF